MDLIVFELAIILLAFSWFEENAEEIASRMSL